MKEKNGCEMGGECFDSLFLVPWKSKMTIKKIVLLRANNAVLNRKNQKQKIVDRRTSRVKIFMKSWWSRARSHQKALVLPSRDSWGGHRNPGKEGGKGSCTGLGNCGIFIHFPIFFFNKKHAFFLVDFTLPPIIMVTRGKCGVSPI